MSLTRAMCAVVLPRAEAGAGAWRKVSYRTVAVDIRGLNVTPVDGGAVRLELPAAMPARHLKAYAAYLFDVHPSELRVFTGGVPLGDCASLGQLNRGRPVTFVVSWDAADGAWF